MILCFLFRLFEENYIQSNDDNLMDIKENDILSKKNTIKERGKRKENTERKPPPVKFSSTYCQVCQRIFYRKGIYQVLTYIRSDISILEDRSNNIVKGIFFSFGS